MGKTNPCEKYELAITNYVIGEKIDIPQKELFDHLAQCLNCQGDLRNWKATYATMRAREYDARPEVQQRTKTFIKDLVRPRPAPACANASTTKPSRLDICLDGAIDLNLDEKVGEPAGTLWQAIGQNEPVNIVELPQVSKLEPAKAFSSFGWLAREKKIELKKNHQGTYVCLTPAEKEKYQAQL
jgi:hypothetical protein